MSAARIDRLVGGGRSKKRVRMCKLKREMLRAIEDAGEEAMTELRLADLTEKRSRLRQWLRFFDDLAHDGAIRPEGFAGWRLTERGRAALREAEVENNTTEGPTG